MSDLKFKINGNGNSTSEYLDHFWELVEARKALSKALRNMHPHERNYQTCVYPTQAHRNDVDMYLEAHKALEGPVDKIIQGVQQGILNAQKRGQE